MNDRSKDRIGLLCRDFLLLLLLAAPLALSACGPKEGTPEWCEAMKNKARGAWTVHEEEVYGDKCAANELERQFHKLLKN